MRVLYLEHKGSTYSWCSLNVQYVHAATFDMNWPQGKRQVFISSLAPTKYDDPVQQDSTEGPFTQQKDASNWWKVFLLWFLTIRHHRFILGRWKCLICSSFFGKEYNTLKLHLSSIHFIYLIYLYLTLKGPPTALYCSAARHWTQIEDACSSLEEP